MSEPLILVHFIEHISRMGDIECLFVTTQSELDAQMGEEIYLGDALGKHSSIHVTMDEENTEVVSTDQEKIKWLQQLKSGLTDPELVFPIGWDLVDESKAQRLDEEPEEDQ